MKDNISIDSLENSLKELRDSFDLSVSRPYTFTADEKEKYIAFDLLREHYAWPLSHTREIIVNRKIIPVPGKHKQVLGVINYKNRVYSVIDPYRLFNLRAQDTGLENTLIVTKGLTPDTAIPVHSLAGIMEVSTKQIRETPLGNRENISRHILGKIYWQNCLVTLLNPVGFSG